MHVYSCVLCILLDPTQLFLEWCDSIASGSPWFQESKWQGSTTKVGSVKIAGLIRRETQLADLISWQRTSQIGWR